MILTIIIVSYDVRYFLEQCLFSVVSAAAKVGEVGKQVEVLVIDNASTDGTVEYLQPRFPSVQFINSKENVGFARANNQALQQAHGEFILFLNPDTILPESILYNCIQYLRSRDNAGALGVRMVDGSGRFLPESKRGFPTPWRSFCKMSGLTSLFPSSRSLAAYQQGHLDKSEVHVIEVVAGAFMMVSRKVLNTVGSFDERFFMYAEDIDLSKRIHDAGFENHYLGNEVIIHFKGESTFRNKRYVRMFYDAMKLYLEKHYRGRRSVMVVALMNAGIGIRSMIAGVAVNKTRQNPLQLRDARFIGDLHSIEEVKKKLPAVADNKESATIIICQGKSFPFSEVIESIQAHPSAHLSIVHACNSCSLVSSVNKATRGLTIPLPC